MQDRLPEYRIEQDKPRDECGIFGMYFHPSLANNQIANAALESALQNQHRGEESAGMIVSDGHSVWHPVRSMGLIRNLYGLYQDTQQVDGGMFGHIAIVHNRYSTTGSSTIENAAPYRFGSNLGTFGSSHNGNITNAAELKAQLVKGYSFSSTTDSEVIGALISDSPGSSWREKVTNAVTKLEGAFCLVLCTKDRVVATRDRHGFHPLFIGRFVVNGKDCFAVSSETPAIQMLSPREIRAVEPGEIIEISENGVESTRFAEADEYFCGLEVAYLMRPDGFFEGVQLDEIRRHHGKILALNYPVPDTTDLVTYIPESARAASEGYAEALSRMQNRSIQSVTTLMKGRYGTLGGSVRGFINPDLDTRRSIASKYYPYDLVKGKEIAVVEDSIVAGVTTEGVIETYRHAVGLYRDGGARKIHIRIVFPQVIAGCPFGVDIDDSRFLVAKALAQDTDKICEHIGADSLAYLAIEEYGQGISDAIGRRVSLCLGCTSGVYPGPVSRMNKLIFEDEIS